MKSSPRGIFVAEQRTLLGPAERVFAVTEELDDEKIYLYKFYEIDGMTPETGMSFSWRYLVEATDAEIKKWLQVMRGSR